LAEEGGSQIQGQPGLHSKILSQKQTKNNNNKNKPQTRRKYLQLTCDKGLIPRTYQEFSKLNKKKKI
jgi:hypothetical protein